MSDVLYIELFLLFWREKKRYIQGGVSIRNQRPPAAFNIGYPKEHPGNILLLLSLLYIINNTLIYVKHVTLMTFYLTYYYINTQLFIFDEIILSLSSVKKYIMT